MGVLQGCLSPKPRSAEIYLETITALYNLGRQNQNLSYDKLKSVLSQSDSFRKLTDNLSTHRNKMIDAANENLKHIKEDNVIIDKYVSLIIGSQIITKTGWQKIQTTPHISEETITFKTDQPNHKGNSLIDFHANRDNRKKIELGQNKIMVYSDSDSRRFLSLYLELVLHLLTFSQINLKELTLPVCQSLQQCCPLLPDKYFENQMVDKIRQKLLVLIQTNSDNSLNIALKCFVLLGSKIKDLTNKQLLLRNTLDLWVKFEQKQEESNLIQVEKQIKHIFEDCVSTNQANSLALQILCFYDSLRLTKVQYLEQRLFDIYNFCQIQDQFLRSLFITMLAYLGLPKSPSEYEKIWKNNFGVVIPSFYCSRLVNFNTSRLDAAQTLERWTNRFSLDNICKYHCNQLIYGYLLAIYQTTESSLLQNSFLSICKEISPILQPKILNCLYLEVADCPQIKTVLRIISSILQFAVIQQQIWITPCKLRLGPQNISKILEQCQSIIYKMSAKVLFSSVQSICRTLVSAYDCLRDWRYDGKNYQALVNQPQSLKQMHSENSQPSNNTEKQPTFSLIKKKQNSKVQQVTFFQQTSKQVTTIFQACIISICESLKFQNCLGLIAAFLQIIVNSTLELQSQATISLCYEIIKIIDPNRLMHDKYTFQGLERGLNLNKFYEDQLYKESSIYFDTYLWKGTRKNPSDQLNQSRAFSQFRLNSVIEPSCEQDQQIQQSFMHVLDMIKN